MPGEAVAQEKSAEQDYEDYSAEAEQAEPVGSQGSSHVMQVDVCLRWRRWLDLSVTAEDCTGSSIVSPLVDRGCEAIPAILVGGSMIAVDCIS